MRESIARFTACFVLGIVSVPPCGVGQVGVTVGEREVTVTHRSRQETRSDLARKLAKDLPINLPKILHAFQAERRDLLEKGGGAAYPKDELAELLDSTETKLRKQFQGDELAPLRDHVAAAFEKARADLGLSSRAARVAPPAQQILLASLKSFSQELAATRERLDSKQVDPVLNWLEALILDFLARSDNLTVNLCVLSEPRGAKVLLRSRSGKGERQKTIARFQNLFRGRYCYKVTGKGFNIPCVDSPENQINLWDKRQPVLECEKGDQDCFLRDGWPQTCHER